MAGELSQERVSGREYEGWRWPPAVAAAVEEALGHAATRLAHLDAVVRRYCFTGGGYSVLTGEQQSEVFSLEVRAGPAHRNPGYSTHVVFQVFDWRYPNLALLRLLERRDADGVPTETPHRPCYTRQLERRLCGEIIPVCNTVLNHLDPTGGRRSVHVDCFHGRGPAGFLPTLAWVPSMMWFATVLYRRFHRDGQLAIIWVDFHHPVAEKTVRMIQRFCSPQDAHAIARNPKPSQARVVLNAAERQAHPARLLTVQSADVLQLGGMSTAVEDGVTLARRYLTAPQGPARASSWTYR